MDNEVNYEELQVNHLEDISLKLQEFMLEFQSYKETMQEQEVTPEEGDELSGVSLDDVFSGVNVLIGLVLGIGVAIAFVKGMTKSNVG